MKQDTGRSGGQKAAIKKVKSQVVYDTSQDKIYQQKKIRKPSPGRDEIDNSYEQQFQRRNKNIITRRDDSRDEMIEFEGQMINKKDLKKALGRQRLLNK